MELKKAIELSKDKFAYRISNNGQILIATEKGSLFFVNKYSITKSSEDVDTTYSDWNPIE